MKQIKGKPEWLDTVQYPFDSRFYELDGVQMHYIDEGEGDVLLFVHGTPTWSFDFRRIIKSLRTRYRCIAIDHIGFGLSDKPKDFDYSTRHHSDSLMRFIEDKNLQNITLVVHDFGGPIGLACAIRAPHRIAGIILFNSWLWSSKGDPDFEKVSKVLSSPLLPFLYRYFNFSAKFLLPKSFGKNKIQPVILKQYTKAFGKASERSGTIAFAKSLLHDQDWFESLWQQRAPIIAKPLLLIWGMKDPVIKPGYLEKFEQGFSNTTSVTLNDAGHYPQEEEPEIVIKEIKNWLNNTKPSN